MKKVGFLALFLFLLGIGFLFFGLKDIISNRNVVLRNNVNTTPAASSSQAQVLGQSKQTESSGSVKVVRVIDGDTIEVDLAGELKKVRFVGINTPETVDPRRGVQCFGKEASAKTKELLLGREVYLEKDVSETDKFGRLLRFVFLKVDSGQTLFVNDYLVREGYAFATTYPPDVRESQRFKKAQNEAREKKLGLWQKCPV